MRALLTQNQMKFDYFWSSNLSRSKKYHKEEMLKLNNYIDFAVSQGGAVSTSVGWTGDFPWSRQQDIQDAWKGDASSILLS